MNRRPLQILVVDDDAARAHQLCQALQKAGYHVLRPAVSTQDLVALVDQHEPDVVLLDVESPGRDTLEQIAHITRYRPRAIALFSPDGSPDRIRAAFEAGVSVYSAEGLPPSRVHAAVEIAVAQFERWQCLREELAAAKQSLADRTSLDNAKRFLMEHRQCGEPEAHQLLQKLAMDRRKKLIEAAHDVLAMADILKGKS